MKYLLLILLASCASPKIVYVNRTYYPDGSVLVFDKDRTYLVHPNGDTATIYTIECGSCDDLQQSQ